MTGEEEKEQEIIVTANEVTSQPSVEGGGGWLNFATYSPSPLIDLFAQTGGGDEPEFAQIQMINGDIVAKLPGYDFSIKILAADWNRLSKAEKGAIIKTLSEFSQSKLLVDTLNHFQNEHVSEIIIRYDSKWLGTDGITRPFNSDQEGLISYSIAEPSEGQPIDDTNIVAGSKIVINLNSNLVNGSYVAEALLHELRHPAVRGYGGNDDPQIEREQDIMYNDIFRGANERSAEDYIDGLTFVGSKGNDIVAGGTAGDTLSGLSGNDDLDGGAGDDLVMGGAGMDRLSGGTGSNLLIGGLDADTYVSSVSVTLDLLSDSGGVDRLDLNSFSITDAVFSRYSDSLCIRFLTSGAKRLRSRTNGLSTIGLSSSHSLTVRMPLRTSNIWQTRAVDLTCAMMVQIRSFAARMQCRLFWTSMATASI